MIFSLKNYDIENIVNIGAADGYYAVGLALFLPQAKILAFESEPRGQTAISRIAEQNGVTEHITVYGCCQLQNLKNSLKSLAKVLLICDVEGFEDVLLDPENIPELCEAMVLVELHDQKNPGVSNRIRQRFQSTHNIEVIFQQKRTEADFPISNKYVQSLNPKHISAAVDEGRPITDAFEPMTWFWMLPKQI